MYYIDDGNIKSKPETTLEVIKYIKDNGKYYGYQLNTAKCSLCIAKFFTNIFKFSNAVINELLGILKELLIKQGYMIDSDTFIFIDDLRSKIRYCFIRDKYPYRKQNAIIAISDIYLQEKFKLHLTIPTKIQIRSRKYKLFNIS